LLSRYLAHFTVRGGWFAIVDAVVPICAGKPSLPTISFIIPVRNDAERLGRCLATIRANTYPARLVEIVVVDNDSTDGSADMACRSGAKVVRVGGHIVSELRNQGVLASSGDFLAFVDADHAIGPDWIVSAVATLTANINAGAVGALCAAPRDGTWVQRSYDLLRRRQPGVRDVEWLGSGNMVVRRQAFETVGGFDRTLHACEDVDLCSRLRAKGYRVIQDSRLHNVHFGDPATVAAVFRGELWRGRDNLRVSLRGRVTLRGLPSVALPIIDLGLLVLIMLGIASRSQFGMTVAALAAGGILAAAVARACRMMAPLERTTMLECGQALVVALTYDLARAISIVRPGGHDARRNG
jgi:hypothetical protein